MGRSSVGPGPAGLWVAAALAALLALPHTAAAQDAVTVGGSSTGSQAVSAPVQVSEFDRLIGSFHRLSPNDLLSVSLYDGRDRQRWEVVVDGNGKVTLPYIGSVELSGLLPHEAATMLQEQYTVYYRQPLIDLSVLEFGRLQVFLAGSDQPGRMVTLSNGETLYDLLQNYVYTPISDPTSRYPDVRPADPGTYRRVHLIRGAFDPSRRGPGEPLDPDPGAMPLSDASAAAAWSDEPDAGSADAGSADAGNAEDGSGLLLSTAPPSAIARSAAFPTLAAYTAWTPWIEKCIGDPLCDVQVFDPLQAAREANPAALNVALQPGDLVYLPTPQRSVLIYGTARNGRYELLEEQTLADVLRLAGTVDLYSDLCNAVVERIDECCDQTQIYVDLASGLDHLEELAAFEVQDRDVIRIQPRERRIFVLGEVNTAGAFDYNYDSIVTDYLAQAGGMTDQANTGWLALIRGNRDRRYPLEPAQVVQVNFKEIHKGHQMPDDYRLLPGDTIYVPPKGSSFSFSNILSSLTSGFAIFQLFKDDNNSNNGNGNGDNT